jgi:hypothetical protein
MNDFGANCDPTLDRASRRDINALNRLLYISQPPSGLVALECVKRTADQALAFSSLLNALRSFAL